MKKLILVIIIIILIFAGTYTLRLFYGGPEVEELKNKYFKEKFCGWSTNHECSIIADCKSGGCSNQICGGKDEELISTCEWTECYDSKKYDVECKCVENKCQWS